MHWLGYSHRWNIWVLWFVWARGGELVTAAFVYAGAGAEAYGRPGNGFGTETKFDLPASIMGSQEDTCDTGGWVWTFGCGANPLPGCKAFGWVFCQIVDGLPTLEACGAASNPDSGTVKSLLLSLYV